ncbi:MAG: hypothetical protein ACK4IB_01605 [Erythrobacter sp.]
MQVQIKAAILGSALVALSGCQSFPVVGKWFNGKPNVAQGESQLANSGDSALEDGRAELRKGNVASAIANFQLALSNRATRADAANGLAVAWANLGRNDLAEQYFMAALRDQPENERFAANLIRLQAAKSLAKREPVQERALAASPVAAPTGSALAADTGSASRGQLTGSAVRISPNEVLIRSAPVMAGAPRMTVQYAGSARAAKSDPATAAKGKPEAAPAGRTVTMPLGS